MRCPLCGFQFRREEATCSSCPLHRHCRLIRCPHCSYCLVEESHLANLLKKVLRRDEEGNGK